MEKIIETYNEQTLNFIGKRTTDGKCSFCGKELASGEYCDCKEAKKKNRFFKKWADLVRNVNDYILTNNTLEEAQKYVGSFFRTPEKFDGMSFEDYEIESDSEKKGFEITVEYYNKAVQNYLTGMNLLFLGKYGTGKTMLMSILCNELSNNYLFSCKYANAVNLWQQITDSFKNNDKSVKDVVSPYKKAQFLFLDDIDKVKPNDYAREIFYDIVNHRTEKELPTVISANHSLEDLDEKYYGEAIVSRLVQNSKIINFTHKNRRFQG